MIDEAKIIESLKQSKTDKPVVQDILQKARELQGLTSNEMATLINVTDNELIHQIFEAAKDVKENIYGKRLVLFAPLYVSNLCDNNCLYCAFRSQNKEINRRALDQEEIKSETEFLIRQGHKRILLVAGESYLREGFDYILKSIETVYSARTNDAIRRINVNIAPLEIDEFKKLKETGIGTYQLFQETYNRDTYKRVHTKGRKSDYGWRLTAIDRAFEAGIDDVGIGVLFGLYDWSFELMALKQHVEYLEERFNLGPHTVSIPRLEPASGSDLSAHPPYPVSDADFRKITAILRLAVPYTGIILSTRENPEMRREALSLGVSQISAGSRTNTGGYSKDKKEYYDGQFSLGDHRSLDEVINDIAELGYIPSFCTACYRLGRTGHEFMNLAKPGNIKQQCGPNALSSFLEYLLNYGSKETKDTGEKLIADIVESQVEPEQSQTKTMLDKVRNGVRDVYC